MTTIELRTVKLIALVCLSTVRVCTAAGADPFANLRETGADWGVNIGNGLVNPGESVRIAVTLPSGTPEGDLPQDLQIHPRYLENTEPTVENIPLEWAKDADAKRWKAKRVEFTPKEAGNYYVAIRFQGHELFSYFSAWNPGCLVIQFWNFMPAEFHAAGNLTDLNLPEVRRGHLPLDYELGLVGELVFSADWKPRDLFRRAQVEAGADVVPFLDGGYLHKLDPEFTPRFNEITNEMPAVSRWHVSKETQAVRGFRSLPDPTFHPLTVEQCTAVIEGARRYWKEWGFRPCNGIATYSPSTLLVESCRINGIKWISGLFADYSFKDGLGRWMSGWDQMHHGMPSFPYLISGVDFRMAGKPDRQYTMMFHGWQNHPLWDHENDHDRGSDWFGSHIHRRLYAEVFYRNVRISRYPFPLAMTYANQMGRESNRVMFDDLIARARKGGVIFTHKRYLQEYYEDHNVPASPDVVYHIPDFKFTRKGSDKFKFSEEAVWEGATGKAGFVSDSTRPLPPGRSIHLPVWWYDYRKITPLSPKMNLPAVDLSGVSLEVRRKEGQPSLVVQSPRTLNDLPICLWDLGVDLKPGEAWIKQNKALRLAAPERFGDDAATWIIRPTINAGETVIPLKGAT